MTGSNDLVEVCFYLLPRGFWDRSNRGTNCFALEKVGGLTFAFGKYLSDTFDCIYIWLVECCRLTRHPTKMQEVVITAGCQRPAIVSRIVYVALRKKSLTDICKIISPDEL